MSVSSSSKRFPVDIKRKVPFQHNSFFPNEGMVNSTVPYPRTN